MRPHIPLANPEITDADREAVLDVLRTPHLSMGPKLEEFEGAVSSYVGSRFAVAVNSGTSALQLAIEVLDLPPGAEVVLPSFTFAAPLNVLLQNKLTPVFVDIDPETLNTTPQLVEYAITSRTQAILAVHTFGRPAAPDQLRELASQRHLYLIEDACEALGAEVHGRKVGNFGEVGALAFYPNKQITTGEGGILLTDNPALAERARRLRNQGRDPYLDWLQQVETGYSYRLSEMNCALGVSQLARIEPVLHKRHALAELYSRGLASVSGIAAPPLNLEGGRISWFAYVIQLGAEFRQQDRDWIHDRLLKQGIQTGRYFAPLHRQPLLACHIPFNEKNPDSLPVTDRIAPLCLALPFFNQLTATEIEEVCSALESAVQELRKR